MANVRSKFYVNIADGFTDDVDELIHRCTQRKPLTYPIFCSIWKEMGMANAFCGRTMGTEIAELSEELIHIVKHCMIADSSNFEEVVASLFIIYALLNIQPFPDFAHLRITPDEMGDLKWIEAVARRERRYDVLYVLGAVLMQGTHFHADERERGMDKSLTKYLDGCTGINHFGARPKGVLFRQNPEIDLVRELNNCAAQYGAAKSKIASVQEEKCLHYCNVNLPDTMNTSLKKLMSGWLNDGNPVIEPGTSIQAIKERAMKTAVPGMKYLQSIEERKTKPASQNALQVTPSSTKYTRKKASRKSPRKRFGRGKLNPRGRKRKEISSSSSGSDDKLSLASDPEMEVKEEESEQTEQKSLATNIEIEIPPKSPIPSTSEATTSGGSKVLCEGTAKDEEINIQIDSLPILIRGGKDKFIEIEIIDNLKDIEFEKNKPVLRSVGKETNNDAQARERIRELKDVSIRKIDPAHVLGECSSVYTSMARISKLKNVARKVVDKRKPIKSRTKSKFKKLGILPVANAEELP